MPGSRPQRTQEHVNSAIGANEFERVVVRAKHSFVDVAPDDYGLDRLILTHDGDGYVENGSISVQLKSVAVGEYVDEGREMSYDVETRHLNLWLGEPFPVLLVVYDVAANTSLWVNIWTAMTGVDRDQLARQDTKAVRLPVTNVWNSDALDRVRREKNEIVAEITGKRT